MMYQMLSPWPVSTSWALLFFSPQVMTSVHLWFCGWNKSEMHTTLLLIDLMSLLPPLKSWISYFWEDTIVLLELAFTEPGFMTMSDGIIFQCCYMTSIHAFWLNIPRSCLKWKAVQDIVIYKWGSFPLSLSRWHGQWHASLVFFSGLIFLPLLVLLLLLVRKNPLITEICLCQCVCVRTCGGELQSVTLLSPHQSYMSNSCLFTYHPQHLLHTCTDYHHHHLKYAVFTPPSHINKYTDLQDAIVQSSCYYRHTSFHI